MRRLKSFGAISIGLSSSGLLALAAPGQGMSVLAWVALVPLLVALRGRSCGSAFGLAFLCGVAANAGIIHWVALPTEVRIVDFLLIAAYLGLWWGLFGSALVFVMRRQAIPLPMAAPVLWVALEYVRSHFFFLELPWILLGHTQYRQTEVIQIASITGVFGISYVIVLVNAAMADLVLHARHGAGSVMLSVGLLWAVWLFGYGVVTTASEAPTVPVTIVPGNVPQEARWDPSQLESHLELYFADTKTALERTEAALVVWPETSVPGQLRRDLKTVQRLNALVQEKHTPVLIGSADREKFGQGGADSTDRYNSAFLFQEGRAQPSLRVYHKMKLLPFGEYVPLPNAWVWPDRYRSQSSHYNPGHEYSVFHLSPRWGSIPFAVSICWESIFPDHVRPFVLRGAEFLVTMSNEAWFSGSAATDQLMAMNVFRAVEFRRTLVRSVNGGLSGFIDPYGRAIGVAGHHAEFAGGDRSLTRRVPIMKNRTFYAVYGDLFAQFMAALAMALVCGLWRLKRLDSSAAQAPAMAAGRYGNSV